MGKSHGLPVDFPLNQSIGNARVSQMESQISPPPEFSSGLHLSRVAPGVSWRMNSRFSAGYVLRAVATWEFQHSPPNKFRVLRGFEEFWGTGHDFLCYWSPPHPPIQGSWKWCVPRRGPQGVNRRVPPPIGMGSDSQGISHWVSPSSLKVKANKALGTMMTVKSVICWWSSRAFWIKGQPPCWDG